MALQGNLEDFSLVEILQLIAIQRKSGVLKLTSDSSSVVLFFEKGNIVSLTDRRTKKTDPLLQFLLDAGKLSTEQVGQIRAIGSQSKKELCEIIVNGGFMNANDLAEAIQRHATELLPELMAWKTGSYLFSGDEKSVSKLFLKVPMRTEALLMESVRRIDESARMKQLYSPSLILRATQVAPPRELEDDEKRVLDLVDGKRPVSEIVVKSRLGEFNTYELLDRLVEAGLVEATQQAVVTAEEESAARAGTQMGLVPVLRIAVLVVAIAVLSVGMRWAVSKFEETPVAPDATSPQVDNLKEEDVRLAIEVHRATNGAYPGDLQQLVSEGLAEKDVPEKFSYVRTLEGFILRRK
jgi:hypothetical protein